MRNPVVMAGLTGHLLAVLLLLACLPAGAQEVVTFTPQGTPQTQYAGYYVAFHKGFFAEEGLDVVLDQFSGSSSGTAIEKISQGKTDIINIHIVTAMIARDKGLKLINVLQTSQVNSLMCVSHSPIDSPQSLKGKRVGRWKVGFAEIYDAYCNRCGIQVEWIPYIQGINLFVSKAVDALLCYSYSEYLQLVLAMGSIPQENVIRLKDFGLDYPEDGLYVTERYYRRHKETVDKFVRASKRGWDYAREHPDEALEITMGFIKEYNVATNLTLQRMMLEEVLRLQINPDTGEADYAPMKREAWDDLESLLRESGYVRKGVKYEEMIR